MSTVFTNQTPSIPNATDGIPYELGMKFRSTEGGQITAIRFWKAPSETGTHIGKIWSEIGTLLATVTFTNETASGWQQQLLSTPLNIQANTTYVVSVNCNSHYAITYNGLASSIVNGNLSSVADGNNGVFNATPGNFPTNSYQNSNYYRDINFVVVAQPTITKISGDNQNGEAGATITNPLVVQVKDSAGNPQSGVTVNFAVTSGGGSVSPISAVTNANGQASTTLTLGNISGVTNTVTATANGIGSVTFSAVTTLSGNNQSVLTSQTPSIPNATDGIPYELGMKFRSNEGGQISAIRFWKAPSETGTHIGKIWSETGTLLATVTFTNETASGWQQQLLPTPLNIQANTIYVVSVNCNSHYVITYNGLASSIVNGNLSSVADGNNGVFNGTPGNFPTNSYQNSNYYRDINFVVVAQPTITKISGDNQNGEAGAAITNPLVVQVKDSAGNPQSGVTVNFAITSGGGLVSSTSVVTNANGQASTNLTLGAISGATLPVTNTVTATANTIGSVTFFATANPSGNVQSVLTSQTPSIPNATDGTAYELGMKFRSTKGGQVTAVRFWKAASETGTHIGKIWSTTGTLLASVTFINETTSGWQEQLLDTPLNFFSNTTYVVSVNINSHYAITYSELGGAIVNGDLSSVADGNNGVYNLTPHSFPTNSYQNSNYYCDIVVIPGSTLLKVSGDNQIGITGATLPNPLIVKVVNAQNNPQPGVTVEFAITSGGGSLSSNSVVTNANGQASTFLTLGPVPTGPSGVVVTATADGIGSVTFLASAAPENPNAIYLENTNPGTTAWKLINRGTGEIEGYASATSVNKGESLDIKVSLGQPGLFTIDVYRLGYYGGMGGRLIVSSGPLNGITQPACTIDPNTRLVECNWSTSYVLQVGNNWTSGFYVAKLTDQASGKIAHVWFVVRDDSSTADLLFQSSVTTVLAYSTTGDYSLYNFNSKDLQRAFKVSFDRPYSQATYEESYEFDTPLRWEYNMIRWLESQSYNVTYTDNVAVHTNGQRLLNHKVFLSVGHDEYWSKEMRDAVEAARDAGTNIAFFSANTCYWRVRFENSTPAAGQVRPNRVMACYKQDWTLDPVAQQQGASAATNKFRSFQNQRPENALLGVMYGSDISNLYGGFNFVVVNSTDPYFANTGLQNGDQLNLLVGYEWDFLVDNGFAPPGLVTLLEATVEPAALKPTFDEPSNEPGLPANQDYTKAHAVRYTANSGAKVFACGTNQWAWGLDSDDVNPPREDIRVKQITVNVLADMGAIPQTPDANIIVP